MLDFTPNPIALQLGPLAVHWYGIAYAVGLFVAYVVITREARWRGLDTEVLGNGMIVVAIAALIGGRLYHVIDQWALYRDDLLKIVLPPYAGLGVYGGIILGTVAAFLYARRKRQPFLRWADAVAPGLFVMQAIGRLGNFFNQELYGAPTNLPWGSRSSANTGPRATHAHRAPTRPPRWASTFSRSSSMNRCPACWAHWP